MKPIIDPYTNETLPRETNIDAYGRWEEFQPVDGIAIQPQFSSDDGDVVEVSRIVADNQLGISVDRMRVQIERMSGDLYFIRINESIFYINSVDDELKLTYEKPTV